MMSECVCFTPGPWRIWEGIDVWIMAGDLHVATIPRAYDGDWPEANARLIASAPDMFDEIERLRAHIHKQQLDIIALGQEVGRLHGVLANIAHADIPRPIWKRFRTDGQPSKNDTCPHVLAMWDDCPDCISDYARAALAEKGEK